MRTDSSPEPTRCIFRTDHSAGLFRNSQSSVTFPSMLTRQPRRACPNLGCHDIMTHCIVRESTGSSDRRARILSVPGEHQSSSEALRRSASFTYFMRYGAHLQESLLHLLLDSSVQLRLKGGHLSIGGLQARSTLLCLFRQFGHLRAARVKLGQVIFALILLTLVVGSRVFEVNTELRAWFEGQLVALSWQGGAY